MKGVCMVDISCVTIYITFRPEYIWFLKEVHLFLNLLCSPLQIINLCQLHDTHWSHSKIQLSCYHVAYFGKILSPDDFNPFKSKKHNPKYLNRDFFTNQMLPIHTIFHHLKAIVFLFAFGHSCVEIQIVMLGLTCQFMTSCYFKRDISNLDLMFSLDLWNFISQSITLTCFVTETQCLYICNTE